MASTMKIHALKAFNDNYIWAIVQGDRVAVVDPGDPDVVIQFLNEHGLTLESILITHKHLDHTGGISVLKAQTNCAIYGPECKDIKGLTHQVKSCGAIETLGLRFKIIALPGHTLEHIGFYCSSEDIFFVGDTLFAGGCGRMFEGTYEIFLQTLTYIASFPPDTKIFCAHEYTEANLCFSLAVEPSNKATQTRLRNVQSLRKAGKITLPSTIRQELLTNPFLRTQKSGVMQAALSRDAHASSPVHIFAAIRQWKDNFNG